MNSPVRLGRRPLRSVFLFKDRFLTLFRLLPDGIDGLCYVAEPSEASCGRLKHRQANAIFTCTRAIVVTST